MNYLALITPAEDGGSWIEFPDCRGCIALCSARESVADRAAEALRAWLTNQLKRGVAPPLPSPRLKHARDEKILAVDVPESLALKVAIRIARDQRRMSVTQFARQLGVTPTQAGLLEQPGGTPTPELIARVAKALGLSVDSPAPQKLPSTKKRTRRQSELFPEAGRVITASPAGRQTRAEATELVQFHAPVALVRQIRRAFRREKMTLDQWLCEAAAARLLLKSL